MLSLHYQSKLTKSSDNTLYKKYGVRHHKGVQTPTKFTNLVSRILFLNYHLSAINITVYLLLPTLNLGRAALKRFYTWHYSTQGLPIPIIAYRDRELLPHVFTFIPPKRESNFLWHYLLLVCFENLSMTDTWLFTSELLCAVRTFLSNCNIEAIVRVCLQMYRREFV